MTAIRPIPFGSSAGLAITGRYTQRMSILLALSPIQPDSPSSEMPMLLFMVAIAGLLGLLCFVIVLWSYRRMKAGLLNRNAALGARREFKQPIDAWSEAGRRMDGIDPKPWIDEDEV